MVARILITAGGTTESIDAVRTLQATDVEGTERCELLRLTAFEISNISKGGFAVEIARAFKALDGEAEITLIGRTDLITELRKGDLAAKLRLVPFRSFSDLDRAISEELSCGPIDAFLMSAAVSDYSPVAVEGKISSDQDDLVIRLKKNPKLLDSIRWRIGDQALLVGFKLLASVSHERLIEVARMQSVRCDCDFTVANDAARIDWKVGYHPFSLVSPEGEGLKFEGLRPQGATALATELMAAIQSKRARSAHGS